MSRHPASVMTVVTCATGTFTVNVNTTGLNLALPDVRSDLGLTPADVHWVTIVYTLVIAATVMIAGAVGDRFNKRTVLLGGLSIYLIGSVLAAAAPSTGVLIGARAVSALGASVLVPVGLAVLRTVAKTQTQLVSYMSAWGTAVGLGLATGPVVGGIMTSWLGWRSFFWTMVCMGVVYLLGVIAYVPHTDGNRAKRPVRWSNVLMGAWMVGLTAFAAEFASPIPAWLKWALSAGTVLLFVGWLVRELRTPVAVIPGEVLRNRFFTVSLGLACFNSINTAAAMFVAALYLQDFWGYSPLVAGVMSAPLALATAVGAQYAGHAITRKGPQAIMRLSPVLMVSGTVMAATTAAVHLLLFDQLEVLAVVGFVVGMAVMGLGTGVASTPVNYLSMSTMRPENSGVAGSAASASRQLGHALGAAVGGSLMAVGSYFSGFRAPSLNTDSVLTYLVPAVGIIIGGLLMLWLTTAYPKGQDSAP